MKKENQLLNCFIDILKDEPRGKVLDIGCGNGDYSLSLKNLGFGVLAADMDVERFCYREEIPFQQCNVSQKLPFSDALFDYIILAEVVEHLYNPLDVMKELNRVLKNGGKIVLSTPNILNLKSRMRFLIEGCWDYFREPPLDHIKNPKTGWNLHVIPWRYHELEYLLYCAGFNIELLKTSKLNSKGLMFLLPLIRLQCYLKAKRSSKKGGLDYNRINNVILSKEILFGEHLVIKAVKN
ncbi:MAG TPA: methyltransferase domain-containing protein [Candidatus Omnitrophota bacterium]|nr:methyltransferase domain-containing protein [Candidatus Omnitrophota bacterium]HPN87792.1 methyltransferase domain-containing protein [Candidatus Omnitrophota bacterium]